MPSITPLEEAIKLNEDASLFYNKQLSQLTLKISQQKNIHHETWYEAVNAAEKVINTLSIRYRKKQNNRLV
ncbi:hypothetical protein [uncultured Shewanella sp.]|uniref:hypothetical protein n=1 Tax=uncultured Shewanella sp. TaxID=173975 RepID=UPI00262E8E7F|nr:hypothetical protein [uncultured Shewanella sp.]